MVGVIASFNLPMRKRRLRKVPRSHSYKGVELGLNPGFLPSESLVKGGRMAQPKFPKQIKLTLRALSALGSRNDRAKNSRLTEHGNDLGSSQ